MSSSRIRPVATVGDNGRTAGRMVRWVGGWAALAVIVHSVCLFVVVPMIDREIVIFVAAKNGVGGAFPLVLDATPAAIVSTVAVVLGAGGAGIAVALYRARPTNAHQVAVVALALIAGALALDAAGIITVIVDEPITEPGLAGGTPVLVSAVVFFSQLVPLFAGRRGRRAHAAV